MDTRTDNNEQVIIQQNFLNAIESENIDDAKKLIGMGAQINQKDADFITPLHYAAKLETTDMTKLLLENKADLHAEDHEGLTPLHYAGQLANTEIVRFLLSKGAKNITKNDPSNHLNTIPSPFLSALMGCFYINNNPKQHVNAFSETLMLLLPDKFEHSESEGYIALTLAVQIGYPKLV